LRDIDRIQLSQLALINCLDALEEKMQEQSVTAETGSDEDDKLYRLLLTYQVRQFAAKMQAAHLHRADKLLMSAYHTYIDVEVFFFLSDSLLAALRVRYAIVAVVHQSVVCHVVTS